MHQEELIRVLLVEDEGMARAGLRVILDSADDLAVVAEAEDGVAALEAVHAHAPNVVVMDVRMPRMDGVEAAGHIIALADAPKILMLTMFDLDEYVYAAIEAGASGFLLKDARSEELVQAVRVVAGGEAMLAPSVTKRLLSNFSGEPAAKAKAALHKLESLTPRERDVLSLVGAGWSNAAIAASRQFTESTVKNYVSQLLTKLDCHNRVQAALIAHDAGLVAET